MIKEVCVSLLKGLKSFEVILPHQSFHKPTWLNWGKLTVWSTIDSKVVSYEVFSPSGKLEKYTTQFRKLTARVYVASKPTEMYFICIRKLHSLHFIHVEVFVENLCGTKSSCNCEICCDQSNKFKVYREFKEKTHGVVEIFWLFLQRICWTSIHISIKH